MRAGQPARSYPLWTELPDAPQDLGLAFDTEPGAQRHYRVRLQPSQP